jgi:Fic family protein
MPELVKLEWVASVASGLSRRDTRSCKYEAYVPDPLVGRAIALSEATLAVVTEAERAVDRLNQQTRSPLDSDAVARLLLRTEAMASSRIEGLEVAARRLLKAQLAAALGAGRVDGTAAEVLNNIEAMQWAADSLADVAQVTVEHLLEIHARLFSGTRLDEYGGKLREQQNWIGGSAYNPCSATFVPPPPGRVPDLLEDMCEFCNGDELPVVAQAAIAHAQFETIHPFIDGNGRTGRALIQMILSRRRLAPVVVPPVSLILAAWPEQYVNGLTATRYCPDEASHEAVDGIDAWVSLFAAATTRAVVHAEAYQQRVVEIQAAWREALGEGGANSTVHALIQALPGAPVTTVLSASGLLRRDEQTVTEAILRLVGAGVLRPTTIGRRTYAYEAADLVNISTDLERRLANPDSGC